MARLPWRRGTIRTSAEHAEIMKQLEQSDVKIDEILELARVLVDDLKVKATQLQQELQEKKDDHE